MYLRTTSLKKDNLSFLFNGLKSNYYLTTRFLLLKGHNYQDSLCFLLELQKHYTPSFSGLSTYLKYSSKSLTSTQSYYYTLSTLVDFLTKREFIYRQYLEGNGGLIYLPNDVKSNPTNPLLSEIKAIFNFNDPLVMSSEYSRVTLITTLDTIKTLFYYNFFSIKNINFSSIPFSDLWLFYLSGVGTTSSTKKIYELVKNPNRPLRKGISNMLRLHSTGAVALPIEIRLQILASSRDVIHS